MPLVATRGAASAQGFGEFAQSGPVNYIEDVFSTYLYTGNGSTQTINNGIDLAGKGGLVWSKDRGFSAGQVWYDTARGAYPTASYINSASTEAASLANGGAFANITGFNSNGYTIGSTSSTNIINFSGSPYVSWTFRKAPKFFDVVTYTGDGTAGRQISHSLGSTPGCVIVKRTDTTGNWATYHRSLSANNILRLNTTDASIATSTNITAVSATTFTLGTAGAGVVSADVNASGNTYVAYLFAHDAGGFGLTGTDNVISCGSFTTNASTTTTVNLGYEPQWVMVKRTNGADSWWLLDNMRGLAVSGSQPALFPNTSGAESLGGWTVTPTATGFDVPTSSNFNESGYQYIYIAIRRGPMRTPTSGTSVFYPQAVAQTGIPDSTNVPFAPDLVTTFSRNGTDRGSSYDQFNIADRLRGLGVPDNSYSSSKEGRSLVTSSTGSEISANIPNSQSYIQLKADGINITRGGGWGSASYGDWIYYFFRRAPGFFDVVCYTGTGANRTLSHNLGVAPELMIVKKRNAVQDWIVYNAPQGATKFMILNKTNASTVYSLYWNNTAPTSTVFTLGTDGEVNASGSTFVAYLFASLPGISKVGSYTGTGTTLQVNCGFTGGARFVLIKRTDSTGDWYVWDSARGIVAGNDPYLLLNSTAAEVTNTDYVDTYSAGFEISSTAPAAINANGGTFIFLAIA